jgi:hypothetical protein
MVLYTNFSRIINSYFRLVLPFDILYTGNLQTASSVSTENSAVHGSETADFYQGMIYKSPRLV